jgi:hypothetical protein
MAQFKEIEMSNENNAESAGLVEAQWHESLADRLNRKVNDLRYKVRAWATRKMLKKIVSWNSGNLVEHARRELPGFREGADEMDAYMANQIVELIAVFSSHGHSGFSAGFATSLFETLSRYKPLGPITGDDDEWVDVDYADHMKYQNKRCSQIFKDADGRAYDSQQKIFRDPDGCCYTNSKSRVYIEFPYTPKTEYVDVDAEGEPIATKDGESKE